MEPRGVQGGGEEGAVPERLPATDLDAEAKRYANERWLAIVNSDQHEYNLVVGLANAYRAGAERQQWVLRPAADGAEPDYSHTHPTANPHHRHPGPAGDSLHPYTHAHL